MSPRTIRYYVSEGLLPAPRSMGRYAKYGPGHLDRLRLIGRLKAEFLPLREIRERIAHLTDAEIAGVLESEPADRRSPQKTATMPHLAAGRDERSLWIRHRLEDGIELSVITGLPPWRERIVRRLLAELRHQLRDW